MKVLNKLSFNGIIMRLYRLPILLRESNEFINLIVPVITQETKKSPPFKLTRKPIKSLQGEKPGSVNQKNCDKFLLNSSGNFQKQAEQSNSSI